VTAVDVSVDGGRRWQAATLHQGQRSQFGWRQREFDWTPPEPAYYTILAMQPVTQPLDQEWNPSGYSWNVVPRVRVDIGADVPAARDLTESRGSDITQPETFKNNCLACHDE
jgi:hypothetical protein